MTAAKTRSSRDAWPEKSAAWRRVAPKIVAALVLLAAGSGCGAGDPTPDGQEDAITHGTPSGAEDDAVAIFGAPAEGVCSGTLVAPSLVLTAKHCVRRKLPNAVLNCSDPAADLGELQDASFITVKFGRRLDDIVESRHVRAIVDDDGRRLCDGDLAVLVLDRPVTTIATREIRDERPLPGETFRAVGWGKNEVGVLQGIRRSRSGITILSPEGAGVNELRTSAAICGGDSGGPLFDGRGRVLGVASRVQPDCARNGVHELAARARPLFDRASQIAGH